MNGHDQHITAELNWQISANFGAVSAHRTFQRLPLATLAGRPWILQALV